MKSKHLTIVINMPEGLEDMNQDDLDIETKVEDERIATASPGVYTRPVPREKLIPGELYFVTTFPGISGELYYEILGWHFNAVSEYEDGQYEPIVALFDGMPPMAYWPSRRDIEKGWNSRIVRAPRR